MTPRPRFAERFESYRPSKTALGWSCLLCAVATVVVGFGWGGWVTGGDAAAMESKAAAGASANLAAMVCVAQFHRDPDAAMQLVALGKLDRWERGDFIKKGAWATLPGMTDSVSGAADLCAETLTASEAG